jgi:hypothetical protein
MLLLQDLPPHVVKVPFPGLLQGEILQEEFRLALERAKEGSSLRLTHTDIRQAVLSSMPERPMTAGCSSQESNEDLITI